VNVHAPKNKIWARTMNSLTNRFLWQVLHNNYYSSVSHTVPICATSIQSLLCTFFGAHSKETEIKEVKNHKLHAKHSTVSMVCTTCGTVRVYEKYASKIFINRQFIQHIIFLLGTNKKRFTIHFSFYALIID
jgi:hypothetical protein